MRAMDNVLAFSQGEQMHTGIEELSLKSIHEDASQVVRLVHSTLYDALQSQASDIHLETTPGVLSIKYRIDGVLTHVATTPGADLAEQVISVSR